jgi:hypothetical protein
MILAKMREKISVNKRERQNSVLEGFDMKMLDDV